MRVLRLLDYEFVGGERLGRPGQLIVAAPADAGVKTGRVRAVVHGSSFRRRRPVPSWAAGPEARLTRHLLVSAVRALEAARRLVYETA